MAGYVILTYKNSYNKGDCYTMTHEPIKYKDSLIHMRDINANWDKNPKRCYCCGEPINKGKALLFINNHKYIPNILLHPECYAKQTDKQTLFTHIETDYKKYKKLCQIFG